MGTLNGFRTVAARQSMEIRHRQENARGRGGSQDGSTRSESSIADMRIATRNSAPPVAHITSDFEKRNELPDPGMITIVGHVASKMGVLSKRTSGTMVSCWKERFFVLSEGYLSYYKKGNYSFFNPDRDQMAYLKGGVHLFPDSIVRKCQVDDRVNCFEVITPRRKFVVQAASIKEADVWIKCITAHIEASVIQPVSSIKSSNHIPTCMSTTSEGHSDKSKEASSSTLSEGDESQRKAVDPKEAIIKHLLEENKQLRNMLAAKNKLMDELDLSGLWNPHEVAPTEGGTTIETNTKTLEVHEGTHEDGTGYRTGSRKPTAPQNILDFRDLRKKQIQLFDAAEVGKHRTVIFLLDNDVIDVNSIGINQTTALHVAAQKNHARVVKELLIRGADHTARNGDGHTPLHLAAQNGNLLCVCELLEAGANPNTTDGVGNGAIHFAAEIADINITRKLIAAGAHINVPNSNGAHPVHLSPIGHPIRVLLGSGKNAAMETDSKALEAASGRRELNDTQTYHVAFKNRYQKNLALGPRDFEFVKVLGRGAFAKVYMVRGRGANQDKWYALKAYNKQAIMQKNQAQYIYTEKKALQACSDHPYIVSLYYAFQSRDRLFLVMEYCGGGDLLSVLTRRRVFSEPEAAFYIGEIALALTHLHSKNIVFRDLKPENVVMDLDGHCLLTDFGISKNGIKDQTSANTFCGSPMYLAPEMLLRSGHGFALDWYSVGALLFELLTGLPPFYANNKKQLFQNILRGNLVLPDYLSDNARNLIQRLLHRDPNKRLGSGPSGDQEIFNHPFFDGLDWKLLRKRKLQPPFRPVVDKNMVSVPDTSNFPRAFTDQEITDAERGLEDTMRDRKEQEDTPENERKRMMRHRASQLFRNFDFAPELDLDREAKELEKVMMLSGDDGKEKEETLVDVEVEVEPSEDVLSL
ncbi:unnamed protein product [Albugo candida]|nr:unnamed protein product [Albugo candida]|eukprot:CCI46000.1 unnamed protein product [Albugo candida]